jgi:hypothetical protein
MEITRVEMGAMPTFPQRFTRRGRAVDLGAAVELEQRLIGRNRQGRSVEFWPRRNWPGATIGVELWAIALR